MAPPEDWSREEVELTIADYFAMLQSELSSIPYSKTEHRNALRRQLNGRSASSVEFKHQNISSVLAKADLPYIRGYKPRSNYQHLLESAVREFLAKKPDVLQAVLDTASAPFVPPASRLPALEAVEPPRTIKPTESPSGFKTRKVDYAEREARNRSIGRTGEQLVVEFERRRLRQAGRPDLADAVRWVAEEDGDGAGYDVLSYDAQGGKLYVEVKTTRLDSETPFYITAREVDFSRQAAERYRLYRVFSVSQQPKVFVLAGYVGDHCRLDPEVYKARIGVVPEACS